MEPPVLRFGHEDMNDEELVAPCEWTPLQQQQKRTISGNQQVIFHLCCLFAFAIRSLITGLLPWDPWFKASFSVVDMCCKFQFLTKILMNSTLSLAFSIFLLSLSRASLSLSLFGFSFALFFFFLSLFFIFLSLSLSLYIYIYVSLSLSRASLSIYIYIYIVHLSLSCICIYIYISLASLSPSLSICIYIYIYLSFVPLSLYLSLFRS